MRSLLDVNVLIALLDTEHVHHAAAARWLEGNIHSGWASCPITQNGCIRIMSQAAYQQSATTSQIADRLAQAASSERHEFWPDQVSLLDRSRLDHSRLLSSRHITDVYLLALAVERGGRLVTFDRAVPLAAVKHAEKKHLLAL